MTDGMFCAQCLSQYQEILSKTRLFGTRNCSKLGRSLYHNCPTIGTVGFYSAVLCSKGADRITNREDPDQTAP